MKKLISVLMGVCGTLAAYADSPYISKVWEYRPAPGQFVNVMPEYEQGDTEEDMRLKADEAIANHAQGMISLGGFGGYVVLGFDHEIPNVKGQYDLKILGNSFYSSTSTSDPSRRGGSSEPGVVMVSRDVNGNGLPDDPWYELAGSEYRNPMTEHNYTIRYVRPDSTHVATPDGQYKYLVDTTYIRWYGSTGSKGYMAQNSFHKQSYYPLWIADDTLTFVGTLLPNNAVDESGTGANYVSYCYDWGYADNQPNTVSDEPQLHASEFDLDWAVDEMGTPVQLEGIHFVKVYTAVNQYNGWLGEGSTEIMDAWDMHTPTTQTVCGATFEQELPSGVLLHTVDSMWQGNSPTIGVNNWQSGDFSFTTYMDLYDVAYYYGFSVSSMTADTSSGWEQPYTSAAGGAYQGQNFCVWYPDFYANDTIRWQGNYQGLGVMVTNTAYTVRAMKESYRMAESFTDEDYLVLYFVGYKDGEVTDSVMFYLARDGKYVKDWTYVDLSPLKDADKVTLCMDGSDKGAYGLNTPTYAALDNYGMPMPKGYKEPAMVPFEEVTAIHETECATQNGVTKLLYQGRIVILRAGRYYDLQGREIR